jgi:hypothetical protein
MNCSRQKQIKEESKTSSIAGFFCQISWFYASQNHLEVN